MVEQNWNLSLWSRCYDGPTRCSVSPVCTFWAKHSFPSCFQDWWLGAHIPLGTKGSCPQSKPLPILVTARYRGLVPLSPLQMMLEVHPSSRDPCRKGCCHGITVQRLLLPSLASLTPHRCWSPAHSPINPLLTNLHLRVSQELDLI